MEISSYKVSRNRSDLPAKANAYGWLEGHLETPHGLVSILTLAKPEADGSGYLSLVMLFNGRRYAYTDWRHRTRREVLLTAGRFAKEAVAKGQVVSK